MAQETLETVGDDARKDWSDSNLSSKGCNEWRDKNLATKSIIVDVQNALTRHGCVPSGCWAKIVMPGGARSGGLTSITKPIDTNWQDSCFRSPFSLAEGGNPFARQRTGCF